VAPLATVLERQQRRSDQFLVTDVKAERAELLERRSPRTGRRVGDEAKRQAGGAHPRNRLHRTRHRFVLDVQHAVEIEQHRPHGEVHPAGESTGVNARSASSTSLVE
jgi:hypothetical protein